MVLSCIDKEERVVINDKYPEQIGRQLPTRIKIRLRDLLKKYIDVFIWTSSHRTGVSRVLMIGWETLNTKHRINVFNHVEPIKQKKRSQALERNEVIHSQVEELTKAGILREMKYQTWVSNPMVVKKDNGKWKLRVDFTNINKSCIREPHPLPTAEQKVEGLHKYRLKCFLDAYKRYHQIPIAEEDKEKTAFFTREGIFYYKRLPFGLKNAGATYQRLIDKVFSHHMGRNMEVNVDDMVIMSDSEKKMMADITETLERLRAINLKLNPKKCSFGVEEGVYSGHLITKQGIRAKPFKVKAVSTLRPPKTVSKMQNLNKNITSLSRFLSKSAKRTLPFMKTLRSCTSGKMVQWTKEADEAFRRMKECLESLPTMVIPIKGETLTMYLATSEEIVRAVLMVERGKKQIPIYFLSRTLHGAELKYPELEKLILALVYAARKLRSVKLNSKVGTPLPENREAKNEEVKRKEPKPKNAWKLFTDRASSSDGLGAGLMVVSPEGKEYTYALRFAFETTNNEA
ncbi:reverse transcriptase domain-containing protein [Tanacetum coccineum]